jgi:hypothetical protein
VVELVEHSPPGVQGEVSGLASELGVDQRPAQSLGVLDVQYRVKLEERQSRG